MPSRLTFANRYIQWLFSLRFKGQLPDDIQVLHPYQNGVVRGLVRRFADKFYDDNNKRVGIIGINPGRFGAGRTGIMFTDPIALAVHCGIQNDLGTSRELSSQFVYMTIESFGGAKEFYKHFYLGAIVPLGFVRHGKNLNFYDTPQLYATTEYFAVESLYRQLELPLYQEVAVILGSGKLSVIVQRLNKKHNFFKKLVILEHPRFVMQYRRRELQSFIERYVQVYKEAREYCCK